MVLSGVLSGASVSYYAHQMVQEYYNPTLPLQEPLHLRFEYGYALFIGKCFKMRKKKTI